MALAWFAGTGFAPAPPATTPAPPATTPAPAPGFAPAPPATTDPSTAPATTAAPTPTISPAATTPTTPTPTTDPAQLPPGPATSTTPPAPEQAPFPDENELPLAPPPHSHPSVPPPPHRYGDPGSTELALALGYTKQTGIFGGGGFRRFILSGVGPGIEASVQRSDGQPTTGLLLASLKLVPARGEMAALIITGRAGRAFMAEHDDGWAAGGSLGVIVFLSPGVGLEIGYSILWLLPDHFCADLVSCRIEGPELGLRVVF
jgi:hypothetical protein